jgi:hypothetical protein
MKQTLFVLCLVLAGSGSSFAGHHGCCADCGCESGLRKVCRWECEEVEITEPGWDCECEDIVIPGKSAYCIEDDCQCEKFAGHLHGRVHHKKVCGPPCDCCVKTVKVLVRTEKKVTKKIWKPVIETVCDRCCHNGAAAGPVAGPAAANGMPTKAPTPPPQGDTRVPMPPMPEALSVRPTSRRISNPLMSFFGPAKGQR